MEKHLQVQLGRHICIYLDAFFADDICIMPSMFTVVSWLPVPLV